MYDSKVEPLCLWLVDLSGIHKPEELGLMTAETGSAIGR